MPFETIDAIMHKVLDGANVLFTCKDGFIAEFEDVVGLASDGMQKNSETRTVKFGKTELEIVYSSEFLLKAVDAEYHIFSEYAAEGVYCMSNHSDAGFKQCCFLLEGFKNFTLDGNGSDFIFEDALTPIIISHCENVTIKGFSFTSNCTFNAQFEVIEGGETSAILRTTHGKTYTHGGDIYAGEFEPKESHKLFYMDYHEEDGRLSEGICEYFSAGHESSNRVLFTTMEEGIYRAENLRAPLRLGQKVVMASRTRRAATIFINRSQNTKIEDVTVYSGLGMGVIAQNSKDIEVVRFNTRCKDDRCYSINADATHFVHCEGKIHIHDCYFEGQLDDALNVHSIYLEIVNKFDNTLLLKQVHCEQAGVNIVGPGDVLESADPDSLIPNGEYKVVSVKRINLELLEVKVEGDISCVRIGDVVDEISHVPEVLFENCTMINNRARSMLLASHGKIVIRNNIFKSAGPAIMFEANGNFWYEAGGTKDVLITGNVFDACKYSYFWSDSVITVVPRKKIEEGKYYHKKIAVVDNTFRSCNAILVSANNVENFIFKGNEIVGQEMPLYDTVHCKTVETDM